MTETATEPVWRGAEALRPFLVAIADLEPFPGNPRRGDVAVVRASLKRFGQVRSILIDGQRIVAGHHLVQAAAEIDWTHIAAIPNEFADEEEARAYLLADNGTHDAGGYDLEALASQLRMITDTPRGLEGTGYSANNLDELLAQLRAVTASSPLEPDGKREHRDPSQRELVLMYSTAQLEQLEIWMGMVSKEKGTAGTSETVYAAVEVAARSVNLGS